MNATQPSLPDDLQRRKNEAEVKKAEEDALKAAADRRKAEVEAAKAATTAAQERITSVLPDLSKVEKSTLDVKEPTPMWGTFLTFGTLKKVAEPVVEALLTHKPAGGAWRVLVTSDPDLASPDAAFRDVSTGVEQLISAADDLLPRLDVPVEDFGIAAVAAAIAGALPGVLSLFSAQRTLSTGTTAANDLAAVAAVVDALNDQAPEAGIVHDDFRLVPGGGVYERVEELADRRQQLVAKKLELGEGQTPDEKLRIALVESLIAAIDAFVTTIRTAPEGTTRTPLASAALHQQLHGNPAHFTHVVLVKSQAGQTQQQLDNRPLLFKDKFSTVADTSVTYMLLQTSGSTIVAAGTVTGTGSARGKVGEKPTIDAPVIHA